MQRLHTLDENLSSLFLRFEEIAKELDLPLICPLSDETTIAQQTYPGIYRIDVCTIGAKSEFDSWIATFRSDWEHFDFKNKHTPSLKKKRILEHKSLSEWMPIYLGKSKNVARRVLEHINLPLEKTTFALKIKARPNMATRSFRLHAVKVNVQNYDIIVPALEAALRDRFHPLVGKQ